VLETLVLQQTLLDGSKDRIICGVFLHFVLRDGAFSINPHVGGYVFDPDSGLKHRPVYGAGFGYNISERWMAEAVLDYVDTEFESGLDMDVFNYRLDGLYHFRPDKKFVPYLAFGAGAITYKPALGRRDTDPLINYGIGAKYFLTQAMALRGDMRHVLSFGDTQSNFVYSLGLTFFFGGERRAAPAAAPELVPAPVPAAVVVAAPLDTDGDGVTDSADRCPGTPAGVAVDGNGCPLDTDGDGIYDYLDSCLGTPKGAQIDARGCWVLQGVQFDTSKSTLKAASLPILNAVLSVLKQNPDLEVVVEGHTDSTGSEAFNKTLSANRAKAVMEFFVSKGIDGSRLSSKGFGSSRPVASNDTREGRAQNRRVELKPVR